jgi:integrase
MAKKLTAISVQNEAPGNERKEIADTGCTGLYLVVQPSGARSWALRYRYLDKPKKLTLGPVLTVANGEAEPSDVEIGQPLTLAAARKLAGDELHKLKLGRDPAADKKQGIATSRSEAVRRAADSVEVLAARFLKQHVEAKNRPATREQVERILAKEVLPRWKGKSVHDIEKRDVVRLLDDIAEDRPILANRTLAIVRKFFNWMFAKDIIRTISPCAGVEPPAKENSRERVLSESEICSLWTASDDIGHPFGPFLKLLILTGQRRSEVAGISWSEIDADKRLWTLPGDRTKNGETHTLPLAPQVWAIIEAASRKTNGDGDADHDHILSTTGKTAISGFSRAKGQLDKVAALRKGWSYHDIRRSFVTHTATLRVKEASGQQRLAVQPQVIEAIVNHISGHKAGVAGVYNRATYDVEKREALELWADHVEAIVAKAAAHIKTAPTAAKVIRGKFGGRR